MPRGSRRCRVFGSARRIISAMDKHDQEPEAQPLKAAEPKHSTQSLPPSGETHSARVEHVRIDGRPDRTVRHLGNVTVHRR